MSVLSWAFIEKPFRRKPLPEIRSLLLRAGLPAFIVLGLLGSLLMKSGGLPQRFAPLGVLANPDEAGHALSNQQCLNLSDQQIAAGKLCAPSDPPMMRPPQSSFGATVMHRRFCPAYQALADAHGLRIYLLRHQGTCWPLLGAEGGIAGNYWHTRCAAFQCESNGAGHSTVKTATRHPERILARSASVCRA